MAIHIAVSSAGALTGLLLLHLTGRAIEKRTGYAQRCAWVDAKYAPAAWAAANACAWLLAYHFYGISLYAFELAAACSICMIISVVDHCIRMIPNGALGALLAVAIVGLIMQRTWGYTLDHLLGLAIGFTVFMIPFLIKKQAGAGDIKFAAVMGLYLGLYNTVVALVVMSVLLLIYIIALLATGKGNRETTLALGPYMSAGLVVTIALL